MFRLAAMTTTIKTRIIRAGGWGLVKRIIKPIPIIGSVFAASLVAYEIKKKGLFRGAVHVGLDVTPVIGTAKNVVEIFTGDLIPDKPSGNSEPADPVELQPTNPGQLKPGAR